MLSKRLKTFQERMSTETEPEVIFKCEEEVGLIASLIHVFEVKQELNFTVSVVGIEYNSPKRARKQKQSNPDRTQANKKTAAAHFEFAPTQSN